MKLSIVFVIILYVSNVFGINDNDYKYELLKRIYNNRYHIRQILKNCNDISIRSELYNDTCPIENKELFISLLDSSFSKWKKHYYKIIEFVYSINGSDVLLRTDLNNSRVINDSVYVHILAGYLGLSNDTIVNNIMSLLLENTAYAQLRKNGNAIKEGIKSGCFDESNDKKEKYLKLFALLSLSKTEIKYLLEENLLTKKQKIEIEKKIELLKLNNNSNLTIKEYCKKYNIRFELPIEVKARLGDDSAVCALIQIYDLYLNNNNDALYSLAKKNRSFIGTSPEDIINKLIYIGSDTCLKYLIVHFNAPVYHTRINVTGGYSKTRNMKNDIIIGLRKHFPEEPILNSKFERLMHTIQGSFQNNTLSGQKYINMKMKLETEYYKSFEKWAYYKFGVKPKDYVQQKK